ncbi:hypothetical protein EV665_113101 [Shinella granuli]|uniref:Uncharacterized protein n=1 Tax=Shinella granuli TaxID=323621 RepID=A0A4R2CN28_SHIGR|nr:hypothetical protein EV665_113101 [Shinella granuli]
MPIILHPAADTPRGVVARRGRRGAWGEDAEPHAPGLRKMVSLRRHGGSGGRRTEPSVSRPERRAGRACAAHKGAGLADASASSAGMKTVRKGLPFRPPSPRRAMADAKTENGLLPETDGKRPPGPAFAEGPKSRAKTAERGAERRHTYIFRHGPFQRAVRCSLKTHGRKPLRGRWCENSRDAALTAPNKKAAPKDGLFA